MANNIKVLIILYGDISSASFFIVLTLLSKNSKLVIKNINVNETRTGIIDILKNRWKNF